jgi:hypothetical protein
MREVEVEPDMGMFAEFTEYMREYYSGMDLPAELRMEITDEEFVELGFFNSDWSPSFKIDGWTVYYDDNIVVMRKPWITLKHGKTCPEQSDDFEQMRDMISSYHQMGRVLGNEQPLGLDLVETVFLLDENDFQRIRMVFEMIKRTYDMWYDLVHEVVCHGGNFEELYDKMEE